MGALNLSPFYLLLSAGAIVLGAVVVALIVRARKPVRTGGVVQGRAGLWRSVGSAVGAVLEAVRYLLQRREWRYSVPWLLLLGGVGSGKSSLAASAGSPRRENLSAGEEALALPGTRWWFFERGVLVDLDRSAAPTGGEPGLRTGWNAVVRGLFNHRPERPIDGVVLTLSARTLRDGSAADLQRLADDSYGQLIELQRRFEFTFPVYVVVTQCDALDGFDAFWGTQPEARRREMVGWSSPYSLDSTYLPAWNDEVFTHLGESLRALQLQAAADAAAGRDVDRYFLFPQRLEQLRAHLGTVLEGIFRPSAFHANFFFRGIYFTGAVGGEGAPLPKVREDVAFVDALLDEKAFAEANLARVNRQGLWSRHRAVRRIQFGIVAAFVLLCVWLGFASRELNREVDNTVVALKMIKDPQFHSLGSGQCAGKESVYALLEHLAQVDLEFNYFPIPISWIDHRHSARETGYIAETAFGRVVFPSLRCHLEDRARTLAAAEEPLPAADLPAPEAAARIHEALVARAQALVEFERNLAVYQGLVAPDTPDHSADVLAKFGGLATYVYGAPPPAAMMNPGGVQGPALARVVDPTPVVLPPNLRERLGDALSRQAEQTRVELDRRVDQGAELFAVLEGPQPPQLANANALGAWMRWVQSDWLATEPGGDPCRRLEAGLRPLLTTLRDRYGYSEKMLHAADHFSAERCFDPAMHRLEAMNVAPYGALFLRGPDGLAVAPALAAELGQLRALAGLRFMQQHSGQRFVCRMPLRGWDATRLAEVAASVREYEEWLAGRAAGGDGGLAERVARRQFEALVSDRLAQAQQPVGLGDGGDLVVSPVATLDEQLRQQSADFSRAADSLLLVIQVLRQRGFEASAARVSQCARDYAGDMLYAIDTLSDASRLYAPGFGAEKGGGPESLLLASLGSDAEVKEYLQRQLQRGQVLGGYAAPFVAFLMNTDAVNDARLANHEAAAYWGNTIGELNRYVQFKEPNGQVAHLDDLFLKQLAGLTAGNCGGQLESYQSPALGNDLFSSRRAALEKRTSARCLHRRETVIATGYQALARDFNQQLAGRYPFGKDPEREAPPAAVKKFLRGYAARRDELRKEIGGLQGERWREVDRFLDQLDGVAGFFGNNLAAGDASRPLQLRIGFRAYPEHSPGSEQLVNWRFRSGTDAALFPNATRDLEWQVGRAVGLDLIWAEQSRLAPVNDPDQPALKVDRNTAAFGAEGSWALLRFLQAHAARAQVQEPLDPSTRLLEFQVPVTERAGGRERQPSRLYLTLQLLGGDPQSGKAAPLRLPDVFPNYAPTVW